MRTAGSVASVRGLGIQDHVCWSYDDLEEFQVHAREFLALDRVRVVDPR